MSSTREGIDADGSNSQSDEERGYPPPEARAGRTNMGLADEDSDFDDDDHLPGREVPSAIQMRFEQSREEEVAVLFKDLEYRVPVGAKANWLRRWWTRRQNNRANAAANQNNSDEDDEEDEEAGQPRPSSPPQQQQQSTHEEVKTRALLSGVSGVLYYGELVALMGGSGCGKSTLLDVLALRKDLKQMTGTLLHDGHQRTGLNTQDAAYVLQTDVALSTLTVFETLMFAARFRMPRGTPRRELEGLVNSLLRELRLQDVAHTRVGSTTVRGISGGEMRRLAIAEALISNPRMIFLDEPTSGLDSAAAFGVGKLLRRLSRTRNQAVICSIHQPSPQLFALFDKVVLLSKGEDGIGRVAYVGRASALSSYLSSIGCNPPLNYNIADFAVEISTARNRWGADPPMATYQADQDNQPMLLTASASTASALSTMTADGGDRKSVV